MSICGGYFKPQPTNYSILPHNLKIPMIQIFVFSTSPRKNTVTKQIHFILLALCIEHECSVYDDSGMNCTDYRPTPLNHNHYDFPVFAFLLLLIIVIQKRSWGLLVGAPPLLSTQRSLIKRRSTERARLVSFATNCHCKQFALPTFQCTEAFQPVFDCHKMEDVVHFFLAS